MEYIWNNGSAPLLISISGPSDYREASLSGKAVLLGSSRDPNLRAVGRIDPSGSVCPEDVVRPRTFRYSPSIAEIT